MAKSQMDGCKYTSFLLASQVHSSERSTPFMVVFLKSNIYVSEVCGQGVDYKNAHYKK